MKTIEELAAEAGLPKESWMTNAPKPGLYYASPERLATFAELVRAESAQVISALQARLERLMLEHCHDEMTPEQIATWRTHQRVAAARPVIQLPISTLGIDDQGGDRN